MNNTQVTEVTKTAPARIWLQVDDLAISNDQPFPADHNGVSWCAEKVMPCEVEYVRADLANAGHSPITVADIMAIKQRGRMPFGNAQMDSAMAESAQVVTLLESAVQPFAERREVEAKPVADLNGWKFNHAQPAADDGENTGVWELGHLDEDGRFFEVLTLDTGNYFQPEAARPLAMEILARLTESPTTPQPAAPEYPTRIGLLDMLSEIQLMAAQGVSGLIDLADPREEALHRVMELLCTSPAVVDTVWHTPHETLHDYCHRAIDEGQTRAALTRRSQDAERYRWLRDALDNEEITEGLHEAFMHGSGALDSAIDAAIAQQAAKKDAA